MVNPNLLRAAMAAKGYRQSDMAKTLKISESSFSKKLNGKMRFNTEEVATIIDELDISSDVIRIFFAKKVP